MTIKTSILVAGLGGAAAIAAAVPASAQIYPFAPGGVTTQVAAERCSAAVQHRLSNRIDVRGFGGQHVYGRVLSVTRVDPRRNLVRVSGLAVSDRYAYGPYGYGAYGALGQAYAQPVADISFRCDVDYRGEVRNIDLSRRR